MTKKWPIICILLCALSLPASANGWLHENVVVSLDNPLSWVNMRSAPSEDASIIALFFSGACLSVTGEPENGWVKVRSQQYEGYMRSDFLDLADGQDSITPGMPIVTLTRDTRMENGEFCKAGTKLLVHGMMVLGNSGKAGLYEVTDGWHYMQIPPEDTEPAIDLAHPSDALTYTGSIPPYAEGKKIGIVHNPKEGSRLHLRKEKSVSSASLGKYYSGTVVAILGEEGEWLHVSIGSLTGYMKNEHVFTSESMWYYGDVLQLPTAKVNNRTGLNLRAGQSTSSKKLGTYENGTPVTVLGVSTSWAQVMVDGQVGFMLLDKLSPKIAF